MMHAIRIHGYGGPEVMELEALATPIPGIGQAVIRVHAASVNFLDVQKRRGELVGQSFYHRGSPAGSDMPATLGSEGVGMVEALGPEVSNLRAGDQVSFAGESYASHAVVPGARLIRIPAGISFEQAAAGMN
jgi:NADPH2:quinone reductase